MSATAPTANILPSFVADMEATLKHCMEQAAACRAEVAVPILVGQGHILVLVQGGMAVGPDEKDSTVWRLKMLTSHRCGISHWDRANAELACAHWNGGAPDTCQVKVIHYRDALIAQAESLERTAELIRHRIAELASESDQQANSAGYEAGRDGKRRNNPHPSGSSRHDAYDAGFEQGTSDRAEALFA